MEEIYNLGLSDNTIKSMLEMNPALSEISKEEVIEKIIILKRIGCSDNQVNNIIGSNSMYLTKISEEIVYLLNKLLNYGFTTLNILFDSNPYILNLEPYEIENYINQRIEKGEQLEDVVDDLDSNPYLFSEI